MESIFILIIIASAFWYFSGEDITKNNKLALSASQSAETYLANLIKGSNANLLAWACNKKGADKRAIARKRHLKNEGKKDIYFKGGGYIYVAACMPTNLVNLNFAGKYIGIGGRFKTPEPSNFRDCVIAAQNICKDFPRYNRNDHRPYKIGYTTKEPIKRINELNNSNDKNYMNWRFDSQILESVWLGKDVELFEKKIHWNLRDKNREVIGEIYCTSWEEIQNAIETITGQILLDNSANMHIASWDDLPF
jgi:hypothetical protein